MLNKVYTQYLGVDIDEKRIFCIIIVDKDKIASYNKIAQRRNG